MPIKIKSIAPWRLNQVKIVEPYRLYVEFNDGTQGEVDLSQWVHSPKAGVFSQLKDPLLFAQVYLNYGVVTWPGEIDLAPDAMYEEIKQHGYWMVK